MDQILVAFESEKTCHRVREILERSGTASCLICRSADQVRRWVNKQHLTAVVCGYKLADETAADVLEDLPPFCAMLVVAPQDRLNLLREERLIPLPAPTSRSALLEGVERLLQMGREAEKSLSRRDREERELIERAKALLMARNAMTEEEAHHFLQKKSMDQGAKLVQVARRVLEPPGNA